MENTLKTGQANIISFRGDFSEILRYAAEFFDDYLDYEPLFVSANFSNDDEGTMIVDFYWVGGNGHN